MKVYCNFGEGNLSKAESLGLDGIRTDVPASGDLNYLVDAFISTSIRPLFLIHDISRLEPLLSSALPKLGSDFDIEIFNEPPGMDRVTELEYITGINVCHSDARSRGFKGRIISGALANLGQENIAYYRRVIPQLPIDITMGFHRYSYKTQTDPTRPWPPFKSRQDELETLHTIANGRELACTEFGYHTAEESSCFRKTRLTDQQVHDFLVADLKLYQSYGIVLAAIYQWRDGDTDDYLGRYGLHTSASTGEHPKIQASAIKDFKNG